MSLRPILITGANGFVGRWLFRAMEAAGESRPIIATSTGGGAAGVTLDVTDRVAVAALIADSRPATVVHLAARSFIPDAGRDPMTTYKVNLSGSLHLAEALRQHAPDCRLLWAGSAEVYGGSFRRANDAVDEQTLLDPLNVYAASKAAADLLLGQYARDGLDIVRFRPFNHFGPEQSDRFVIASFARQIAAIEASDRPPLLEVGNLASERDFLDVRDVVNAYHIAMTRPDPLPSGTVLNIASGVPRSIASVLDALLALSPLDIDVRVTAGRSRVVDIPRAIGNAGLAAHLLNWRPRHAFSDSLEEVMEWARKERRLSPPTSR